MLLWFAGDDVVFWRCLIGALTLLVFIVLSRQPFSRLTRFTLALAVIGGAALVVNWLLLFAAYSRISIGMATVVYNTQPFMLVLMGMVLGERVKRREMGMVTAGLWRRSDPAVERADACTRRGAYHRRVAGAGRGILLCPDRHHRAQTAVRFPAQHIAFIQGLVGVVMLLPLVHAQN